jgi:uncharacterized protein YbjT (DUF2867 family)
VYEATGPQSLTFAEVARTLSEASGLALTYVPVPAEGSAELLAASGMDPEEAAGLAAVFVEVLDGRNEALGDGVQRALGREPRSFASYARRAAATGAWAQPSRLGSAAR